MDSDLATSVEHLAKILTRKQLTLVAAESCTGGLLAASLTDVAGSSLSNRSMSQVTINHASSCQLQEGRIEDQSAQRPRDPGSDYSTREVVKRDLVHYKKINREHTSHTIDNG